jgi:hypothetical protein
MKHCHVVVTLHIYIQGILHSNFCSVNYTELCIAWEWNVHLKEYANVLCYFFYFTLWNSVYLVKMRKLAV